MVSELKKKKIAELEKSIKLVSCLLAATQKKSNLIGWIRFSVFLTALILFFVLFFASMKTGAVIILVLFTCLFIAVSIVQNRYITLVEKQKKWIEIKSSHLARINLNWTNIPRFKIFDREDISPLEADLDLTGNRSLHQLIDYSKTKGGSLLLRSYFISGTPDYEEIIKRQNIVKELLMLSHFREKFLLVSALSSKKEIDSTEILNWLIKSNHKTAIRKSLNFLFPLCFINLFFIGAAVLGLNSPMWLLSAPLYLGYYFLNQGKIRSLASDAETISGFLGKTIGILSFIEDYKFGRHKNLESLSAPLKNKDNSPTKQINRINRFITMLSFRNNPFVWGLFIILFPIDYYLAYKVESSKSDVTESLPQWLDTWHKFEAFVSLSVFANLNPEYIFPEILNPAAGGKKIELNAAALGHPLIPAKQKVCNNYSISGLGSISLITGSNMSGKSTFLRTVGINLCLAYSGAPVNAENFSAGIMRIFSCIKVSDSVIDGISYFYAEVKRLKLLLDEIEKEGNVSIIYLIDEIFKGTNNIERLKGSKALIKALAGKNGSGLISTHDLELVKIADSLSSLTNYHFREEIKEGRMLFDYKLNNGPCPTTNALIIMQTNGLPVE